MARHTRKNSVHSAVESQADRRSHESPNTTHHCSLGQVVVGEIVLTGPLLRRPKRTKLLCETVAHYVSPGCWYHLCQEGVLLSKRCEVAGHLIGELPTLYNHAQSIPTHRQGHGSAYRVHVANMYSKTVNCYLDVNYLYSGKTGSEALTRQNVTSSRPALQSIVVPHFAIQHTSRCNWSLALRLARGFFLVVVRAGRKRFSVVCARHDSSRTEPLFIVMTIADVLAHNAGQPHSTQYQPSSANLPWVQKLALGTSVDSVTSCSAASKDEKYSVGQPSETCSPDIFFVRGSDGTNSMTCCYICKPTLV